MATNDKAREKGILRAVFNDQSIEAARQRPQDCNFTCIDYQGDKNRRIVNMATMITVENSFKKHKKYINQVVEIYFKNSLKMETPIQYK